MRSPQPEHQFPWDASAPYSGNPNTTARSPRREGLPENNGPDLTDPLALAFQTIDSLCAVAIDLSYFLEQCCRPEAFREGGFDAR